MKTFLNKLGNYLIPDRYTKYLIRKLQNKELEFRKLNHIFRNNSEIAMTAVSVDGINMLYISQRLKKDKAFILQALTSCDDYMSIWHFSDDNLKKDKDLALSIVKKTRFALLGMDETLSNDKDIILTAVTHSGDALEYAHQDLKADKDIVIAAVTEWGSSLKYASEELKDDKEVVCSATRCVGIALKEASPRWKYNSKMLIENYKNALDMIATESSIIDIDRRLLYTLIYESPDITLKIYQELDSIMTHDENSTNIKRQDVIWNIYSDESMKFILHHKDKIAHEHWPLIQEALIQNPNALVHPQSTIEALIGDSAHKYLMLAHYALGEKLNIDTDIDLPNFDINI